MAQQKHVMFNPVTPDISPPPSGLSRLMPTHPREDNVDQSRFSLNTTADVSAVTSIDIQEMENVRNHLQNMTKTSKGFNIDNDYDETIYAIEEGDKGDGANTSATSVDTAAFLQKLLPNSSPMEELRVHFDDQSRVGLTASLNQTGTKQGNRSVISTNQSNGSSATNRTLMSDNSLLREHLDREKFKRKHCEHQIQDLHSKMLEVQQELAVAVSSERKKDVMIEQLDKTLAKVVEGWKKHENEKLVVISTLKQERDLQDQAHQKQQEMLLQFEKELEKAVEALTKEQEKATEAERQKQEVIEKQAKDREELLQVLGKEKERVKKSEQEKISIIQEKEQDKQKYVEAQRQIEELSEKNLKLRSELKMLKEEFSDSLITEKKKIEEERKFYKENKDNAVSLQKDIQKLEMELDTTNREKESLKMEMSLMQARHEASKAKEETERQAELEKQMNQRLEELHQHMTKSESGMRESHRKQIQEISNKHKEEMQQQLDKFHEEIKRKDTKLKSSSCEYEERLTEAQDRIASLTNQRQQLENQRQNLNIRMHQMMQAHCDEALHLLSTNRSSPPAKLTNKVDSLSKTSPKEVASNWQTSPVSSIFSNQSTVHTNKYHISYQPTNAPNYHVPKTSIPTKHITPNHYNPHNVTKHSMSTSQYALPNQDKSLNRTSKPFPNDQIDHSRLTVIGNQSSLAGPMPVGYPSGYHGNSLLGNFNVGSEEGNEGMSRSGVDFVPLRTIHDDNDTESVISGLHGSPDSGPLNATSCQEEYQSKVMSSGGSNGTLLEQDLEESHISTTDSPEYRLSVRSQRPDISDKLHEQEQRQAELNHYVNMLLKRSPGQVVEEMEQLSDGLIKIPSSSVAGMDISQHNLGMAGSNSVTKDNYSKKLNQQAFIPAAFSKQSVQPQTPPRRDKDPIDLEPSINQPSLTPKQMKQLSKLLSLMAEGQTGVHVPSADQLFGVLKEMQFKGKPAEIRPQDGHQTGKTTATRHNSSNLTRRNLDTSFPPRKQKPVSSNPISEQLTKTDQQKPRQPSVGGAPSQRTMTEQGVPRHQAPTKASSKHIQPKAEKRSLPIQTGKQTRSSTAWR